MATAPATSVTPPVVRWSPTHVVTEVGMVGEKELHPGSFAQPQDGNVRLIEPVPGSLYGHAVGKTMVLHTGWRVLPNYPPEQEILERPQFVPGKGWVSSAG